MKQLEHIEKLYEDWNAQIKEQTKEHFSKLLEQFEPQEGSTGDINYASYKLAYSAWYGTTSMCRSYRDAWRWDLLWHPILGRFTEPKQIVAWVDNAFGQQSNTLEAYKSSHNLIEDFKRHFCR